MPSRLFQGIGTAKFPPSVGNCYTRLAPTVVFSVRGTACLLKPILLLNV